MIEGRQFTIFTDHKPLTYAFQLKTEECSPRQFNHLNFISQFSTDIRHVAGQKNVVADALSRVYAISQPFDIKELANSQQNDNELKNLLKQPTSMHLERKKAPDSEIEIFYDVSTGNWQHPPIRDSPSKKDFRLDTQPEPTGSLKASTTFGSICLARNKKRLQSLDPKLHSRDFGRQKILE